MLTHVSCFAVSLFVAPSARAPRAAERRTWRRDAAARSWLVLLTALGLLLAQGPALLHLLLVPHRHLRARRAGRTGARQAGYVAPAPAARERLRRISRRSSWPAPTADGHEHCDALALRHHVPAVDPSIGPATLLRIDPIEAGGAGAETRPVALLSLAPKSSPPVC